MIMIFAIFCDKNPFPLAYFALAIIASYASCGPIHTHTKSLSFVVRHRSVMFPHTRRRPEPLPYFLKMKGAMPWVCQPKLVILVRKLANLRGKSMVKFPKLRSCDGLHGNFTPLPSRSAALPCAIKWSSRPASTSAFICWSHSSSSNFSCIQCNNSNTLSRGRFSIATRISATLLMLLKYGIAVTAQAPISHRLA